MSQVINHMHTLAHGHLYSITTSLECFLGLGGFVVGSTLTYPCGIPCWSVRLAISCQIGPAMGSSSRKAFVFAFGPRKVFSKCQVVLFYISFLYSRPTPFGARCFFEKQQRLRQSIILNIKLNIFHIQFGYTHFKSYVFLIDIFHISNYLNNNTVTVLWWCTTASRLFRFQMYNITPYRTVPYLKKRQNFE